MWHNSAYVRVRRAPEEPNAPIVPTCINVSKEDGLNCEKMSLLGIFSPQIQARTHLNSAMAFCAPAGRAARAHVGTTGIETHSHVRRAVGQ